jgi:hypothetical protein
MNPEVLLEVLFTATGAKTDEEKARIAWRFSDAMWDKVGSIPIPVCRHFNDLLKQQEWPWITDLWSKEEVVASLKAKGVPDEAIKTMTARQDSE